MNADLFDYFSSSHSLTLLESEICDIEHVVNSTSPDGWNPRPLGRLFRLFLVVDII